MFRVCEKWMLAGLSCSLVKTYGILEREEERIYKMRTFAEISAVQKSGKMNSPNMIISGVWRREVLYY